MAGTFDERIRELAEKVGDGTLSGKVVVDQRYAKYQHERLDLKHDEGRIAKYLETPLHQQHEGYLEGLARNVLDGDLEGAMASNMEDLADQVEQLAPIDFNDLPRSGNPVVVSNGEEVYNRPPIVPRLTEEQLKAKRRLKNGG